MYSIDFHGKTWADALPEFIALYNRALAEQAGGGGNSGGVITLDVIHGYGATGVGGVLKRRIRGYLARHTERLEFRPGEAVDGNQGHTLVTPARPLPETAELLAEQILEYCETPRAQSKITGRFRRYGDPQTLQAIRSLERQGRLRADPGGKVKRYRAV